MNENRNILRYHTEGLSGCVWLILVSFCGLAGCGRNASPAVEPAPPHMGQIVSLYFNCLHLHHGVGPRDAEEFKRFIRTDGAAEAKSLGVDLTELDALFISQRDQRPIIINYGLRVGDNSRGLQIMAYEARGRDGKRAVAFMNGTIDEVDANRAAQFGLKAQ